MTPPLARRLLAEFLGSALLAAVVIGSGIAAAQLSQDTGLQLLENAAATAAGLFAIILMAAISISTHHRASPSHLFAEVIATCGLILVIFALVRSGRAATAPAAVGGHKRPPHMVNTTTPKPAAVGAYIGAAYWFNSSTSFANPAISIGRIFSDTFAGIAPASVPPFIVAQLVGAAAAFVLIRVLYPDLTPEEAADVVVAHDADPRPREPVA